MSWLYQPLLSGAAQLQSEAGGGGGTEHALAGSISASSIIGNAPLDDAFSGSGGENNRSTLSGALSLTKNVVGQFNGNSTIGSALNRNFPQASEVSGDSDFDGNTALAKGLLGGINSISTLSGDLTITGAQLGFRSILAHWLGGAGLPEVDQDIELEGSIFALSRLGADVSKAAAEQGGDTTNSALNGLVTLLKNIVGQLYGQSTLGAAANKNAGIDTSVSGDSEFDGALTTTKSLVGALRAQSTLGVALNKNSAVSTAVSGDSHFDGNLSTTKNIYSSLSAYSTLGVSVNKSANENGQVSGDSDFDGALSTFKLLNGQISGRSSFNGTLFVVGDDGIVGSVSAKSRLGLDLLIHRNLNSDAGNNSEWEAGLNNFRTIIGSIDSRGSLSGVLSNTKSIASSIRGQSRLGAEVTRIFGVNSGITSSSTTNGELALIRNLISSISGKSTITNSEVLYLVGLNSGLNSNSQWNASANLSSGLVGGIGGTPSLSLGLLLDKQLIAQLYALGILSGELTVVSIPTSFEIVNFTLNIMKENSLGNLSVMKQKDIDLNVYKQMNLMLER